MLIVSEKKKLANSAPGLARIAFSFLLDYRGTKFVLNVPYANQGVEQKFKIQDYRK